MRCAHLEASGCSLREVVGLEGDPPAVSPPPACPAEGGELGAERARQLVGDGGLAHSALVAAHDDQAPGSCGELVDPPHQAVEFVPVERDRTRRRGVGGYGHSKCHTRNHRPVVPQTQDPVTPWSSRTPHLKDHAPQGPRTSRTTHLKDHAPQGLCLFRTWCIWSYIAVATCSHGTVSNSNRRP